MDVEPEPAAPVPTMPAIRGNTVWIAHEGRTYSATFTVQGDSVSVFHGQTASAGRMAESCLLTTAAQLLYELAVCGGAGIPDDWSSAASGRDEGADG